MGKQYTDVEKYIVQILNYKIIWLPNALLLFHPEMLPVPKPKGGD